MLSIEQSRNYLRKYDSINEQIEEFKNAAYSISSDEYREILNDYTSTDEQIQKRLQYLESFCRNIARLELQNLRKTKLT